MEDNVENFENGSPFIPVEDVIWCDAEIGGKGSFGKVVGVSSSNVKSSRMLTSLRVLLYSSSSSRSSCSKICEIVLIIG